MSVTGHGGKAADIDLSDAEALIAGQYVRCAICGQWVGPSDLHRLTIEDAVLCWRCGDVGLLGENLVCETVFTYRESIADRNRGARTLGSGHPDKRRKREEGG